MNDHRLRDASIDFVRTVWTSNRVAGLESAPPFDDAAPSNLFAMVRVRSGSAVYDGFGDAFIQNNVDDDDHELPAIHALLNSICEAVSKFDVSGLADESPGEVNLADVMRLTVIAVESSGIIGPRHVFDAAWLAFSGALYMALARLAGEFREPSLEARLDEQIGELYARVVPDLRVYAAAPNVPPARYGDLTPNEFVDLESLHRLGVNGTKGHLLERQALVHGFSTRRFHKAAFVADDGVQVHDPLPFRWSRSPLSSVGSLALCTHKQATRIVLERSAIPVPSGRTFDASDFAGMAAFARHVGFPVVCKPASGVRGIGVITGIEDETHLEQALALFGTSALGGDDVIIEQHVGGNDYRMVVVEDQLVSTLLRVPASVTGDGINSVGELVLQKNALRRNNPHLWARPIKLADIAYDLLERAGLTLSSVPAAGQQVVLSTSCSISQGGDSIDVLDEVHPTVRDMAIAATKAVPGLRFCGVDVLMEDHRKPLDQQASVGICELNAHANVGTGVYPMYGEPREVARALFLAAARRHGYTIPSEPQTTLDLHLDIWGRVTAVGYRAWMSRNARQLGLRGWVRNVANNHVEARVAGEAVAASALASLAIQGPGSASPTSVRTTHSTAQDRAATFEGEDFAVVG